MMESDIPLSISSKPNYRLGDLILLKTSRYQTSADANEWNTLPDSNVANYTLAELTIKNWPNSLASQYLRETNAEGDVKVLSRLVGSCKNTSCPNLKDAVLHLRVGDIIDNVSGRTALDFWARPTSSYEGDKTRLFYPDWSYYVLCEAQFCNLLDKFKSHNISGVKLVYGVHTKGEFPESKEYIRLCKECLEREGFEVELVNHADADEAFTYMCNAKTFFSTGGGFGRLIGDIVEYRGGTYIPKEKYRIKYVPTYRSIVIFGLIIALIFTWVIWRIR